MKRRNVIDIIERFQLEHALKEERETKSVPVPPNRAIISGATHKNGGAQKVIFENEHVRVSITSIPKGIDWSMPHDGRDRIVVLLDKTSQVPEANKKDSFSSSAWHATLIPANSNGNTTNQSDQTKNLMILEFKDTAGGETAAGRGGLIDGAVLESLTTN
jgi:hypothetical protein